MNTDQTLTQLVQSLLEIGLMIAAGIIASAVRKYALVAATKLHIQLSEHDRATIDSAVHTMALVGNTMLRQRLISAVNIKVTDDSILKLADVVVQTAGDSIAKAGLTKESIAHMLVAQIDDTLGLPDVPIDPPNTTDVPVLLSGAPAPAAPAAPAAPGLAGMAKVVGAALLMMALMVPVSACTDAQLQEAQTVVTQVKSAAVKGLQDAVNIYGVAKGMALVAEAAFPEITPIVTGVTTIADPIAAAAKVLLAQASIDDSQAQALTTKLADATQQLTLTAAPKITVVANGTAGK